MKNGIILLLTLHFFMNEVKCLYVYKSFVLVCELPSYLWHTQLVAYPLAILPLFLIDKPLILFGVEMCPASQTPLQLAGHVAEFLADLVNGQN